MNGGTSPSAKSVRFGNSLATLILRSIKLLEEDMSLITLSEGKDNEVSYLSMIQ